MPLLPPPHKMIAVVFGATGFLGRAVVRRLAREGVRIRALTRNPGAAGFLKPMGEVGQIEPLACDMARNPELGTFLKDAHIAVNLVGILHERGRQRFGALHADLPQRLGAAARAAKLARLLHISALGADTESASRYARTKAEGDAALLKAFPKATILRPSLVFGADDHFFNRFAAMARLFPALPLIGGGHTRFQPIHVLDVAEAVWRAVPAEKARGRIYELGGPDIYTFRELMRVILTTTNRARPLVPIPFAIARIVAQFAQFLPGAPLTPDQVALLGAGDTIVSPTAKKERRRAENLGITPAAIDAVVPAYLARFRAPSGKREEHDA